MSDIPKVLRTAGPWTMTRRVWKQVHEDNLPAWAAALAYSWLFAIFPFVIFLLSLLPYLPTQAKATAREQLAGWVARAVPGPGGELVVDRMKNLLERPNTGLLSVFGLVLTVFSASGGMNMTISALDKCYELDQGRPMYKQRPLAIGLTIIVATLVLAVLVLLPLGTLALKWIERNPISYVSGPILWTWRILRYPLALTILLVVVEAIYYWGPSIKQRWVLLTPGGAFCIIVWLALGYIFRLYVELFGARSYNETYGAVGGVAILLLFFYMDALVLLVGAEINSEIDFEALGVPRGSRDFRTPIEVKAETPPDAAVSSTSPHAGEVPDDAAGERA
jgi:membrane protein